MPPAEPFLALDTNTPEVFTLPEVAAYLRLSEEQVLELIKDDAFSGQQIGGEWRFLKQEVVDWLISQLPDQEHSTPKPGSKQAVLRHFGVFEEDADLDEQLNSIRANRKAAEE